MAKQIADPLARERAMRSELGSDDVVDGMIRLSAVTSAGVVLLGTTVILFNVGICVFFMVQDGVERALEGESSVLSTAVALASVLALAAIVYGGAIAVIRWRLRDDRMKKEARNLRWAAVEWRGGAMMVRCGHCGAPITASGAVTSRCMSCGVESVLPRALVSDRLEQLHARTVARRMEAVDRARRYLTAVTKPRAR